MAKAVARNSQAVKQSSKKREGQRKRPKQEATGYESNDQKGGIIPSSRAGTEDRRLDTNNGRGGKLFPGTLLGACREGQRLKGEGSQNRSHGTRGGREGKMVHHKSSAETGDLGRSIPKKDRLEASRKEKESVQRKIFRKGRGDVDGKIMRVLVGGREYRHSQYMPGTEKSRASGTWLVRQARVNSGD